MSQENVEMIVMLYPGPDVDVAELVREDAQWAAWASNVIPFLGSDFHCVQHEFGGEKTYDGPDAIRAFMLNWVAPWAAYRVEIEKAIDLGERVVLLNNDRGRRDGSTLEVRGRLTAIWTLREGKLTRLDAYANRQEGLAAVGLEE